MNYSPAIIVVALATVTASLFGLVLIPDWQMDTLGQTTVITPDGRKIIYPRPLEDAREKRGREVYKGLGCLYCHSQQVRPPGFGADIERGWGQRRSVPRDYIYQTPPLTGTMRTGPDLAHIAARQPSRDWHYLHLYDPQITSPGSIMPPFRFLFETYVGEDKPSLEARQLPADSGETPTWIVPNEDARSLVAYLMTLEQPFALEEVQ